MFSILVATFQFTIVLSFILFIPITLIMRLYTVRKNKTPLKESLLVVLIPFSLGYYFFVEENKRNKYYNLVIVLFLIVTLIGILFTVYQLIPPFLNP